MPGLRNRVGEVRLLPGAPGRVHAARFVLVVDLDTTRASEAREAGSNPAEDTESGWCENLPGPLAGPDTPRIRWPTRFTLSWRKRQRRGLLSPWSECNSRREHRGKGSPSFPERAHTPSLMPGATPAPATTLRPQGGGPAHTRDREGPSPSAATERPSSLVTENDRVPKTPSAPTRMAAALQAAQGECDPHARYQPGGS